MNTQQKIPSHDTSQFYACRTKMGIRTDVCSIRHLEYPSFRNFRNCIADFRLTQAVIEVCAILMPKVAIMTAKLQFTICFVSINARK